MQNPAAGLIDRIDALPNDNAVFRAKILLDGFSKNGLDGGNFISAAPR